MSTTDNLEQKARGWYAKEYHIDIDKCGRGHSAHQVCLDLAAFARSLAPPPAKGLSDEEITRIGNDLLGPVNDTPGVESARFWITKALRHANGYLKP